MFKSPAAMIGNQTAEELRAYAKSKEEEMLRRVSFFRERKEKELKRIVAERVLELEMKKTFADALKRSESVTAPVERLSEEMERMIERIETAWLRDRECTKNTEAAASVNDVHQIRQQLVVELDKTLTDYRFQRESAILKKYETFRSHFQAVKSAENEEILLELDVDSSKQEFHIALGELDAAIANDDTLVSRALRFVSTDNIVNLNNDFSLSANAFLSEIRSLIDAFRQDVETTMFSDRANTQNEKGMLRCARRLTLAIQKRVVDLEREFERRKSEETREISAEYRMELTKLLVRYLALFRTDNFDEYEVPVRFSALFDQRKTPLRDRVKFITSVFEKFPSADLAAAVYECVSAGVEAPYRLYKFYSA